MIVIMKPKDWEEGIMCSIYKKEDKLKCENYHGITLLNAAYKIFSGILLRLSKYTDKIIGNYQAGFRKDRQTSDQIHALRQMLEKTLEYNISTYHLFVDFKSAYDSVIRSSLFKAKQEFQIPKKLISLTEITLKTVKCRIKIGNDL